MVRFLKLFFKESVRAVAVPLFLFGALAAALAFTEPSVGPTGGTVYAPVNTSATAQTKSGNFTSSGTVTGNIVNGTTQMCLAGSCISSWPSGGGSGLWASSGSNIYNTNGGNVGIGTAAPAGILDVLSSASPVRITQGSSQVDYLQFRHSSQDANNKWGIRIRDLVEGDFGIRDLTANAYRLYINASGNIGVGTTGPGQKLQVVGTGAFDTSLVVGTDYGNLANEVLRLVRTYGSTADVNAIDTSFTYNGGATITNAYGMYLRPFGVSGVGSAITNNYGLIIDSTGQSGTSKYGIYQTGGTGVINYFAGNVGIGTTNPGAKLDVQGVMAGNFGTANSCCASGPTLSLSEGTNINNRLPWLQFHTAGFQEAYLRLAKDTRLFEMGDNQGVGVDLTLLNGAGTRSLYLSPRGTSYFNGGNVGIGTASPGEKLDVNGNIVFNSVLRTPWRMYLYGTELLYLLNTAGVIVSKAWGGNGNLTVEGSLCLGGVCQSSWPSVGVSQIVAGTNVTISPASGTGAVTINASGGGGGQWQTNGSSIYYNNGNVGIGTASPLQKLHIVGSGLASRNFYVQSPLNPGIIVGLGELQSAIQDWPGYTLYGIGWDSASGGIGVLMPPSRTFGIYGNGGPANFLVTGNTTLVGNVGIGSGMSSPWAQLDVGGGVGLNIPAFRAMDNSFSKYIFIVPYLGTGGYSGASQSGDSGIFSAQNTGLVISPWNASGIRISPSGDVNVGAGVFVNSGGYAHFNSTLDAQDYWIRAIGRWASSLSDVRLKKDIQPLTNVLDKLSSVHGVSFNWNEAYTALGHPNDARQIGVIAQELETSFPELVTASNMNGYKTVNYEGLTAVLLEAVKEQQKEIDSLKARLDALEAR